MSFSPTPLQWAGNLAIRNELSVQNWCWQSLCFPRFVSFVWKGRKKKKEERKANKNKSRISAAAVWNNKWATMRCGFHFLPPPHFLIQLFFYFSALALGMTGAGALLWWVTGTTCTLFTRVQNVLVPCYFPACWVTLPLWSSMHTRWLSELISVGPTPEVLTKRVCSAVEVSVICNPSDVMHKVLTCTRFSQGGWSTCGHSHCVALLLEFVLEHVEMGNIMWISSDVIMHCNYVILKSPEMGY